MGEVLPDSPFWALWVIRLETELCAVCGVRPSRLDAMGYGKPAGLGTVDEGWSTGMVAVGAETAS